MVLCLLPRHLYACCQDSFADPILCLLPLLFWSAAWHDTYIVYCHITLCILQRNLSFATPFYFACWLTSQYNFYLNASSRCLLLTHTILCLLSRHFVCLHDSWSADTILCLLSRHFVCRHDSRSADTILSLYCLVATFFLCSKNGVCLFSSLPMHVLVRKSNLI